MYTNVFTILEFGIVTQVQWFTTVWSFLHTFGMYMFSSSSCFALLNSILAREDGQSSMPLMLGIMGRDFGLQYTDPYGALTKVIGRTEKVR